jgi:hypothetical protein
VSERWNLDHDRDRADLGCVLEVAREQMLLAHPGDAHRARRLATQRTLGAPALSM